jgi:hypothetical protein
METENLPLASTVSCICDPRITLNSTSGGSSETELKLFAVSPCHSRPEEVTTVIPVAKRPSTSRSARGSPSAGSERGRPAGSGSTARRWPVCRFGIIPALQLRPPARRGPRP